MAKGLNKCINFYFIVFRPIPYERILKSQNTLKSFIGEYLPNYDVFPVKGDGLCTFHAFIKGIHSLRGLVISMDDLYNTLKEHLMMFKDHYKEYHESGCDLIKDLDSMMKAPLLNYDSDTGDLYLLALGHAFDVNIVVFRSTDDHCNIYHLTDENASYPETLFFGRSHSVHIDPIIPKAMFKVGTFNALFN